ncbi:MAG: thymidylate synthase [Gammaproteobacteria bacterium]|nr:thymidylate synthase [Gammaproteobacteria bacterium]
MKNYLDLLTELVDKSDVVANHRRDRTGVGTVAVFARRLEFDLRAGFPLLTTKRVHFRSVAFELLWFLRGMTNISWLNDNGVSIWDEWADDNGELGDTYGAQWRRWPADGGGSIDQIADLVDGLRKDPNSRRHLVAAWNPGALSKMALPPCHVLFQMYVENGLLSCQVYQRSCDVFLGLPFNIASYALLTHLVAQICSLQASQLVWTGGDVHLYLNHTEAARTQLARSPGTQPRLEIRSKPENLWDFRYEDIAVHDYNPQPTIKAKVAV